MSTLYAIGIFATIGIALAILVAVAYLFCVAPDEDWFDHH